MASFLLTILLLITGFLPFGVEAPSAFLTPVRAPPKRASILIGGDMMFDRSIRAAAEEMGSDFVFSCVKDTLFGADIVVANLEGPITSHASMSVGSEIESPENVTFTFPTSTAALLARHNIMLVNIGNNHILNFGSEGLAQTREWLTKAGVNFFGDPETDNVAEVMIKGIPFSFVSWSDWTGGTKEKILGQVRAGVSQGRIVIVYAHWGEEYVPVSSNSRELAHSFVDAGAEIVIGSHPHIIQENEVYGGKHVYYSLGNLVFDQYWDEDVRTGLLLKIVFSDDGVKSIEEIKTYLERDRRTCLIEASPAL